MAKYKDFILFDNFQPISMKEMMEYVTKCGLDPSNLYDKDYIRLSDMISQGEVDDFYDSVQKMPICDEAFVIDGKLKLWYGYQELPAKVVNGLFEAITSCAVTGYVFRVKYVGSEGCVVVETGNDYGICSFTIHALTSKGKEYVDKLDKNGRKGFDLNDSKMYLFRKIKPSELNHSDDDMPEN